MQQVLGEFAQVVIATAAPHAAGLLKTVAPAVARRLQGFEHQAILTTYLAWPAQQSPPLPAVRLLDEVPARQWHGQWLFDRGVIDGLRVASVVTSARDTLEIADNDQLADRIVEQVVEGLGLPAPSDRAWVNERRATSSCTPGRPAGHPRGIDDLALPAGLYLAGDYVTPRYPATLEGALRSGEATAAAVLQDRSGP
ncbi:MAG: FAD-dependent oxidoreductase [Burkholderiaceae bacterium]